MSVLKSNEEIDFSSLKNQLASTSGNLSVQLRKLENAGYISIRKSFEGNTPRTTCRITNEGLTSFLNYAESIKSYIL